VRLTVLHNPGQVIPISRSWWQIAIRTNNVEPSFDDDGLPLSNASSSSSVACAKILRTSSVGRRRSGEARKFLCRRR